MLDPSKLHLPIQPLTYATVAGRVKRKRVITIYLASSRKPSDSGTSLAVSVVIPDGGSAALLQWIDATNFHGRFGHKFKFNSTLPKRGQEFK